MLELHKASMETCIAGVCADLNLVKAKLDTIVAKLEDFIVATDREASVNAKPLINVIDLQTHSMVP